MHARLRTVLVVLALALSQLPAPGVAIAAPASSADSGAAGTAAAVTDRFIIELGRAPAGVARARAVSAGIAFDLAAYEAGLIADQDAVLAALASAVGATLATTTVEDAAGATSARSLRWTYTYNGFAVTAPADAAAAIAQVAGVAHVQRDTPVQAFLAESVPYIGAPGAWASGYRGQGQTIADIDTGIDWTHPMFTNDPALPPGPLHPKVKFYLCLTAGACTDDFGHGSHVGGISAGDKELGYSQPTPAGVEIEAGKALFNGVAPKADLWGYKVLTTSGSGVTTSIVTAIDDAAKRGAKVINLSLGSTDDDPNSANSKSVDNAMKAGTTVAVAAGNSGPGYQTIGTPATARLPITVGATTDPGDDKFFAVDVTASPARRMNMILMSNSPRPPTPAVQAPYVYVGEGCTPADYAAKASVIGKIALIKRGTCTFTVKGVLAQSEGAAAALIFNNVAGDFSGSMEQTDIVVAGISDANGAYLVGFTGADGLSSHQVLIDPNPETIAGRIAGFSSRGPTKDYRIKPDVVAPGNAITSATSKIGIPTQSMANPSGYTTAGGTSMATPHVAGASALVRQAHPAWSPFDVRLALMNTAKLLTDPDDGKLYSIQDQGAGLIDIPAAIAAKSFLYVARPDLGASATEGSYSFGQVENVGGVITKRVTFTLRDISGVARTYALAFLGGDGKNRGGEGRALPAAGFSASLSAASVTVPANGTATVTLTVTADGAVLRDGDYEGRLVATASDQTLRAPVFYRAIHRATAAFPAPTLTAPAESETGSYTLSWNTVSPAVGYRVQQARNPGTTIFSDDAEAGLGKWTVAGTTASNAPNPAAWTQSPLRAHGGGSSFFAFQGPNQNNTLTLATPLTIPAGSAAALSFWTYVDTEPGFDFGYIDASHNGTSWGVVGSVNGFSNGWVKQDIDLAGFGSGPLYLRFRYVSDTVFDAGLYEGWYVDDISVSTSDWATLADTWATTYSVTGQPAGTYYHRVAGLFDTPTIQRAEGPWSNVVTVTVKLPDLAISPADIVVSQDKDVSTIIATVHNIGTAGAANVAVRFQADGTAIGPDQIIASVPAGGTGTAKILWDVRHLQGDHTITVTADPTNAITEMREDNNTASRTVTVRGNRVRNGSFETATASGQPDGWTAQGGTTYNSGPATASDGTRSVSVTGNGLTGGTWTSSPITVTAGETITVGVTVIASSSSSAPTLSVNLLGSAGIVQSTAALASGATKTLSGTLAIPAGITQVSITLGGFSATDLAPRGTVTFDDVTVY